MIRTQIQLTEEQARRLRLLAEEQGKSVAELIRASIDQQTKNSSLINLDERRRRALALAGKYSSGKSDISLDHDRYLAEDFG